MCIVGSRIRFDLRYSLPSITACMVTEWPRLQKLSVFQSHNAVDYGFYCYTKARTAAKAAPCKKKVGAYWKNKVVGKVKMTD